MERIQDYLKSMNNFARIINESGRDIFFLKSDFLNGEDYLVALPKRNRKPNGPYGRVEFAEGDIEYLADILTKGNGHTIEREDLINEIKSENNHYLLHKSCGLEKDKIITLDFLEKLMKGYPCRVYSEKSLE